MNQFEDAQRVQDELSDLNNKRDVKERHLKTLRKSIWEVLGPPPGSLTKIKFPNPEGRTTLVGVAAILMFSILTAVMIVPTALMGLLCIIALIGFLGWALT